MNHSKKKSQVFFFKLIILIDPVVKNWASRRHYWKFHPNKTQSIEGASRDTDNLVGFIL